MKITSRRPARQIAASLLLASSVAGPQVSLSEKQEVSYLDVESKLDGIDGDRHTDGLLGAKSETFGDLKAVKRKRITQPPSIASPVLNETASARYLGIAVATLRKRRRLGQEPAYVRIGRRVVYQLHDLDGLLAAGRVNPSGGPR